MSFKTNLFLLIDTANLVKVEHLEVDGVYRLRNDTGSVFLLQCGECEGLKWRFADQEVELDAFGCCSAITTEGERVHIEFRVNRALTPDDL